MKTVDKVNKNKDTIIINPELSKLNEQVLFPEKVEKARQTIERIGLPKKKKI